MDDERPRFERRGFVLEVPVVRPEPPTLTFSLDELGRLHILTGETQEVEPMEIVDVRRIISREDALNLGWGIIRNVLGAEEVARRLLTIARASFRDPPDASAVAAAMDTLLLGEDAAP